MISKLTQLLGEVCLILSKNRTAPRYAVVKKSRLNSQFGSKISQILLFVLLSCIGFSNEAFAQCVLPDNIAPDAACVSSITISLDSNGDGTLTVQNIDNGSSDACGITNFSLSQSNFDCDDIGTTASTTLTVSDAMGNSNTCMTSLIIEDNLAPTITCPADVSVDCGDATTVAALGDATAVDNCDTAPSVTSNDMVIMSTSANCQSIERTFTATDNSATLNTSTCVQTITIDDTVDPVLDFGMIGAPNDVILSCMDAIPVAQIADMTDNCAADAQVIAIDVSSQGGSTLMCDFYDYTITRTWTAMDDCGNTDIHTQLIVIENSPLFTGAITALNLSANSTVGCPNSCSAEVNLDLTNDLTYNCGIANSQLASTSFALINAAGGTEISGLGLSFNTICLGAGVYNANFSATDYCGNTTTHTVVVTIADNLPPTANCLNNISIALPSVGQYLIDPINDLDNNSSDNCATALTYSVDIPTLDCNLHNIGNTVMVTMTVSDGTLTSSCITNITILDNPPVPYCQDITVALDVNGDYVVQANELDNNSVDQCNDPLSFQISADSVNFNATLALDCSHVGVVSAVLEVSDASTSGNPAICYANITVEDNIDPVAMCGFSNYPVTLNNDGMYTFDSSDSTLFQTLFSDNCDFSTSASINTFDCSDVGVGVLVTITVIDANGLAILDINGDPITCDLTVDVGDSTPPLLDCADIEISVDGTSNVTIFPEDLIAGSIFLQSGDNGSGSTGVDEICITASNATTLSFDYSYITSDTRPTIGGVIADRFDYSINGVGTQVVGPTNILPSPLSVTLNAGDQFCLNVFTLDNLGGSASVTVDNFSAGLLGDFAISNWDAPTSVNSDGDIFFNDACGIDRYEIRCGTDPWTTSLSYSCADLANLFGGPLCGPQTKSFEIRAYDVHTNVSLTTCTSNVTFIDKQPPVPICDDKTISLSTGAVTVPADLFDDGSFDGCSDMSPTRYAIARPAPGDGIYQDDLTFDCDSVGVFPISLRVEDCSGNQAFCNTTITVQENQPPKIHCSPDITIDCAQSTGPTVTGFPVLIIDACSATVDTTFADTFVGASIACSVITRTWTATDLSGNSGSCVQLITVEDNIAPTFTVPADITLSNCENPDNFFTTGFPNDGLDNCDPRVSLDYSDAGFVGSYAFSNWTTSNVGGGTGGSVAVYGQCAPTAFINTNQNRLFLDFNSAADALAFFNASGGNVMMTVNPGGSGTLFQTSNTSRLRIDITTLTAGPFTGTITSPTGTVCTYDNGDFTIDNIQITGTDDFICATMSPPIASEVNYSITIPFDGTIRFNWDYVSSDSTGTGSDDPFGYILNGVFFPLSGVSSTQSNVANITVVAGDIFAFSQQTNTSSCGSAMTSIRNFRGPEGCTSSFVRSWIVSDDCGNETRDDQLITLDITNSPTITFPNSVSAVSNGTGTCSAPLAIDFSNAVSGNCGGIDITNDALTNFGVGDGAADASGDYPVGTNTVTFTVASTLGCFATETFEVTVIVQDGTSPFLQCSQSIQNILLNSAGQGFFSLSPGLYTASDACGIANVMVTPNNFDCSDVGVTNTVLLTVSDPSGNTQMCNLNINVIDSGNTTLTCPADVTVDCASFNGITANFGSPVTGSVCGAGTAFVTGNMVVSGTPDNCFVFERTWSDGNNTCMQTITVEDTMAPVIDPAPADTTITFSDPNLAVTLNFTDNCATAGTVTSVDDTSNQGADPCTCNFYNFDITRNWIVMDGCGNQDAVSQMITIRDDSIPTFTFPNPLVISNDPGVCGAQIDLTIANFILDDADFACLTITNTALSMNIDGLGNGNGNATNDIDGFYPVGSYDIEFVVTDPCGNTATEVLHLVIEDDENVALSCFTSINVELDNSGNAIIDQNNILNGPLIDNCMGNFTFAVTNASFDCTDLGLFNSSTLTVTDASGNANTCSVIVNVLSTFNNIGFSTTTSSTSSSNQIAADGTATVAVTGTGSYSFIWNDANAQTTATATGLVPGLYMITITDDNTGCIHTDEVVVAALCPTFTIGQVTGDFGQTVSIPVTIENFNNIVSFQFTMNVNSVAGQFVGASGFNLPGLSASNFSNPMSGGTIITVSWIDPGGAPGTTLPDGTVAFNLDISINGAAGNSSAVSINSTPVNYEIGQFLNGNVVSVPGCSNDGSVSVNTSLSLALVCGNIVTENGTPVENVSVLDSTSGVSDVTDANGDYCLSISPGSTACVEPSKTFNHFGSSSIDLFLIQQHVLGNALFTSPYQVIAADANNSGSVSTLDLVDLQFLILGNYTTLPNNDFWRFVDANQTFANPLSPFPYDDKITLGPVNMDFLNTDFVAVAIGDVNGTAQTQMLSGVAVRNVNSFDLQLADQIVKQGTSFEVTFSASELADIAGYQTTLEFEAETIQFEGIETLHIDNLSESNFALNSANNGVITLNWYGLQTMDFKDGDALFTLKFTALNDIESLQGLLRSTSAVTNAEAYKMTDNQLEYLNLNLIFNENTTIETEFALFDNRPNPFKYETTIGFTLPQNAETTITVYDVSGRILTQINNDYSKGYNEFILNTSQIDSYGVLYYEVKTQENTATGRMILLK